MSRARVPGLTALFAIPSVAAASGRAATFSLIVFSADRAPTVTGKGNTDGTDPVRLTTNHSASSAGWR